tara:strand:- start:2303 stop:2470 length:168 start_codon:yes stop_codon:yes gene_type:complete
MIQLDRSAVRVRICPNKMLQKKLRRKKTFSKFQLFEKTFFAKSRRASTHPHARHE